MTRARKSDLVLDGRDVALRLKAERKHTSCLVHVDWVRFTCRLKNVPVVEPETLFSGLGSDVRRERLMKALRELPDPDFSVSVQAKELADKVCEALGPDFSVCPEVRKGYDFYRCRWSIVRNDTECGWVGYLASGDSPRQQAQASTIHANLYGTACTFARPGFNHRLADLVRAAEAVLTRVDLALDLFDGLPGGMERVLQEYKDGLMDNAGRRPSCNMVGDWANGRARSFYFGSKEAGKQTNLYEKGHQLFGPKDDSPWWRGELRYGNKLRVLEADILNRPDDFFAGASDWHAALLREAGSLATPAPVPTTPRLASESIMAEVKRNVRWLRDTASASMSLAFQHLGVDDFLELVTNRPLPGRLAKHSETEVQGAYRQAFKRLSGSSFGRLGLQPYEAAFS